MITKDSVNDNISSNQIVMLQSPEAALTIMIITTTIIIIITKIRAITTINSIDFTKIGHHLVLHSKSAPVIVIHVQLFSFMFNVLGTINSLKKEDW